MIRYFIAYNTPTGGGNTTLHRDEPIRDHNDVAAIAEMIRTNTGVSHVIITSWQRYED